MGTGAGSSIVRKVVENHGGYIAAFSNQVKKPHSKYCCLADCFASAQILLFCLYSQRIVDTPGRLFCNA
jgi:hypothetical protein